TLGAIPDPVVVYDPEGRVTYVNSSFTEMYGWTHEDVIGFLIDFVPKEEMKKTRNVLDRTFAGEKVLAETKRQTRDGGLPDIQLRSAMLFDSVRRQAECVVIHRDISKRKRFEQERETLITDLTQAKENLHFQATHDELTGLRNRPAILDRLNMELSDAKQRGVPVGIMIADIDHFKAINDRFGHLVGDAALREVTRRIVGGLRPYDSVGRYGGEEFIIICPGSNGPNTLKVAERLRVSFSESPIVTGEGDFNITVSFGVSALEGEGTWDPDSVIRAADEALYRAKSKGRDRVKPR
ncbi:diguanylate cyclase, partial [Thermodesulfobacteriota bacterium]